MMIVHYEAAPRRALERRSRFIGAASRRRRLHVSASDPHQTPQPSLAVPEALIGIGLLVAAVAVFWQTATMPVSPMYSKVGPTVFPYMTAAGLAVLALLLFLQAMRGGWQP